MVTKKQYDKEQKAFRKQLKRKSQSDTTKYFLKRKEGPGRPRGDYKHRDPFTGKPIPATVYYKRKKDFDRFQQQKAQLQDQKEIQQLAKRGIPPEQARPIVNQRQLQSVGVTQQPQPQQLTPEQLQQLNIQRRIQQESEMPEQMPSRYPSQAVRPIWRRQPVEDTDWGLFGRKKVVRGVPQSFWN